MEINALYTKFVQHPVICTDTRKITAGCLFFALQGANFDGNSFAEEALKQGAAYAVVSDPSLAGPSYLYVEDTLHALQSLAQTHRLHLHIPVIGITGSNGKTTTKELVSFTLSAKYKVHATSGNLNNHIGVPLTILSTPTDTEIIVCEMGANHIGEISLLCEIAMPTHGIITNIGNAHLEGFGSIEGVQKGKGELFNYLQKHKGHAFINVDDPRLRSLGAVITLKTTYGFDLTAVPDIHFNYTSHKADGGFTIYDDEENVKIHSSMFGFYNAMNVLAAYTIGQYFDVPKEKLTERLSSFIPGSNRSESISFRGSRIIKDAYNANPTSMELALRAFAFQFPNGWIVLGDMKELGSETENAHRKMISIIEELGFQNIVLIGKEFKAALMAKKIIFHSLITADQIEELSETWNWEKCEGQSLLLKGSRSMHLEKLLEL